MSSYRCGGGHMSRLSLWTEKWLFLWRVVAGKYLFGFFRVMQWNCKKIGKVRTLSPCSCCCCLLMRSPSRCGQAQVKIKSVDWEMAVLWRFMAAKYLIGMLLVCCNEIGKNGKERTLSPCSCCCCLLMRPPSRCGWAHVKIKSVDWEMAVLVEVHGS